MRTRIALSISALLSGCFSSGVIETGPDSFMARAHSTLLTIDPAGGGAIANATELAGEHCAKLGKHMVMQNSTTTPMGAGAQAIVNFECVYKNDRDYVRPKIRPMTPSTTPSVIINNRNN